MPPACDSPCSGSWWWRCSEPCSPGSGTCRWRRRPSYQAESVTNRLREVQLKPERGRIIDVNGRVLVDNKRQLVVTIERDEIAGSDDRALLFNRLSGALQVPVDELEARYESGVDDRLLPFPVDTDVTEATANYLMERREDFPGVEVTETSSRVYRYGPLAANVIGYMARINPDNAEGYTAQGYELSDRVGIAGIERYYEGELRGTPGKIVYEVDARERVVRVVDEEPAIPGNDVQLTIDIQVQQLAEQTLDQALRERRTKAPKPDHNTVDGSVSREWGYYPAPAGAVVVEDPANGNLLALASNPPYDPRWFSEGISQQKFEELFKPEDPNGPLFDRATQGGYAPASTFKPFVAYSALRTGLHPEPRLRHQRLRQVRDRPQVLQRRDRRLRLPELGGGRPGGGGPAPGPHAVERRVLLPAGRRDDARPQRRGHPAAGHPRLGVRQPHRRAAAQRVGRPGARRRQPGAGLRGQPRGLHRLRLVPRRQRAAGHRPGRHAGHTPADDQRLLGARQRGHRLAPQRGQGDPGAGHPRRAPAARARVPRPGRRGEGDGAEPADTSPPSSEDAGDAAATDEAAADAAAAECPEDPASTTTTTPIEDLPEIIAPGVTAPPTLARSGHVDHADTVPAGPWPRCASPRSTCRRPRWCARSTPRRSRPSRCRRSGASPSSTACATCPGGARPRRPSPASTSAPTRSPARRAPPRTSARRTTRTPRCSSGSAPCNFQQQYTVAAVLQQAGFGADAAAPVVRRMYEGLLDPPSLPAPVPGRAARRAPGRRRRAAALRRVGHHHRRRGDGLMVAVARRGPHRQPPPQPHQRPLPRRLAAAGAGGAAGRGRAGGHLLGQVPGVQRGRRRPVRAGQAPGHRPRARRRGAGRRHADRLPAAARLRAAPLRC